MSNYRTPGVYIEQAPNALGVNAIVGDSELVGAFMGIAERGKVGVPYEITSWGMYLSTFALSRPSPFLINSELAYAVYGFFQNGGTRCYVMRVAHIGDTVVANNATAASVVVAGGPTFTAVDEGTWGNSLSVRVFPNEDDVTSFNISIALNEVEVEKFVGLSNTASAPNYWVSSISGSKYATGSGTLISTDVAQIATYVDFTTGADGLAEIEDADYIGSSTVTGLIRNFDVIDTINLISIPGETSDNVVSGLLDYCNDRKYVYAVIDCDYAENDTTALAMVKTLSGYGSFLYPWIKVVEPLSASSKVLHDCPPSGHVQGVMARIARNRGVWKAPAGTEATIQGAVDTVKTITLADSDKLSPAGVICIVPKADYGILVWGAKSISGAYVPHVLIDQYIKKAVYNGTQLYVFEPNNQDTWMRITTQIEAFLNTLWQRGCLVGEESTDAYYVRCDETTNLPATVEQGYIYCEIGYKRPGVAEFVVFRFSHEISK